MKFAKTIITMAAAILLASCGDTGAVYAIPAKDMRQKLMGAKPPSILFGNRYITTRAHKRGDGSIVWSMYEGSVPRFRFIAQTEAVDAANTKITLDIAGPTDDEQDPVAQKFEDNPEIAALYLKAMEEAIDSKLMNRSFDMTKFQTELLRASVKQMPNIRQSMNKAAAASDQMDQARAEAEQAASDAQWEREIEAQYSQ